MTPEEFKKLEAQAREDLKELNDQCADFEIEFLDHYYRYLAAEPRLHALILAFLTDFVVNGLVRRFGAKNAMFMISERTNQAVEKTVSAIADQKRGKHGE